MKKARKREIKIVLGGFLAILMITLVSGYFITKDRIPETTSSLISTEAGTSNTGGDDITITVAATTTTTTKVATGTTEPTTTNKTGNPFNPKTVSITEDNWEMVLVSSSYCLPDNYVVNLAPAIAGSSIKLDSRVAVQYQKMYDAAKLDGCVLTPCSGYRSYTLQKTNYTNKVNYYQNQGYSSYDAQVLAAQWIMPPGCSEHNMGVAMDIVSTSETFANTKEFKWLEQHAAEYGFIERYKKDKFDITKVSWEPWHWRYVGVENAQKIKDSGKCLEEYLGIYNT